jgi:hypothetical protein
MTTGQELKEKLGLSHLKYVSFIRLIETSQRILIIFYDSRRVGIPLTKQRIFRSNKVFVYRRFPFLKNSFITPLIPIEDYNGPVQDLLISAIDLSGLYGDSKNQVTEKYQFSGKLLQEFLTLKDLQNTSAVSSFTKRTRKERNEVMKTENYTAKLIDVELNEKENYVTFGFLTEATEPIYPDDFIFGETNPEDNFEIDRNESKTYEMYIKILDFFTWLRDTRPEDAGDITRKDIKEVLEVSNIQLFSTSPSWHWQGINFWLSQLDGSIYPTDIEPKFWNREDLHGNDGAFLDKHLAGLLNQISFFLNPMASMLTKRLRDNNLL